MNLSPDQSALNEPKLTAERRAREISERSEGPVPTIGSWSGVGFPQRHRDPAAIGDALGLPALQAERLLKRYQ